MEILNHPDVYAVVKRWLADERVADHRDRKVLPRASNEGS
jgi:hypothetical protein